MNINQRLTSRRRYYRSRASLESLEPRRLLAGDPILDDQPLIISEFVADNTLTLTTRIRTSPVAPFEGEVDSPDWIEILNISKQTLDLGGMHLTDDPEALDKWSFPDGTLIEAGEFLTVFASGEDITDPSLDENGLLHTNFGLDDDGEYLALTDRSGAVIHEFAPAFPSQSNDISYSVPMNKRPLIEQHSAVEYLVPSDDSLEPAWRRPDFTHDDLVQSATAPVGFDRGGGSTEAAETIGDELIDRGSIDFSRGSIVVLESTPFTQAGRVIQWSFYSEKSNAITPLILQNTDDGFEIVGIGATRLSDGSGVQSFPFELQSGSDTVNAEGYFFGFKDGDNQEDDSGVIVWERSDAGSVRRYNGPLSGSVQVGTDLGEGRSFERVFSVQATTGAVLAGPINSNVDAAMADRSSAYIRFPFVADQLDTLKLLTLNVRYEDGFVAYLNGVEVARRNAPDDVSFDSTAAANRSLRDANAFEEINITRYLDELVDGQNVLALHGLNDSVDNPEFLIDAELTGVAIPSMDGIGFAPKTTPGDENDTVFPGFSMIPEFSHGRGFYSEPFMLQLTTPDTPAASIYFTTDGTFPGPDNLNAQRYTQPLSISETSIVRAASYQDDLLDSGAETHTYIFTGDVVEQDTLQPAVTEDAVWGSQMEASLLALPTVSLVTETPITVEGEIGTSAELMFPDGSQGFQVDAGVEVFGGTAVSFPKRSMRISFKNIYGPATFNYDLFNGGVTEFDQLLLRPGSHDTPFWNGSQGDGAYIRNRWTNDRQLDMGQPAPRGRFVQLYLNGTYWGQYQLMERPNAAFMAARFGGDKSDYDALNRGNPVDGDDLAWQALLDAIDDGYEEIKKYLDVVNFADYVLLQYFGGNDVDWRSDSNWMAARRREPNAGFQFFAWDSDIVLRSGAETDIVNFGGPGFLLTQKGGITQYPEFRRLLAERAQRYFFDDGMFTSEQLRTQIDAFIEELEVSVIAETARWGSGIYTPETWLGAMEWIKQTYAPQQGPSRAEIVIEQMRHAGLFPLSDQPTFSIDGQPFPDDTFDAGTTLGMSAPEGDIYYTLDGSDPRAQQPSMDFAELVTENSPVRVRVPDGNGDDASWMDPDFDDSDWTAGTNGVGYDTTAELTPLIQFDVEEMMHDTSPGAYVRIPFEVDDPGRFDSLEFSIRYDDGFVAYLNGVEVARRNVRGTPTAGSRAFRVHQNVEAIEFEGFNLSRERHLLRPGENVLAVHGTNTEASNVDFLVTPILRAGTVIDPGISPAAERYSEPIEVANGAQIMARTLWGNQWSTLRRALATDGPFPLRITEVMYHPSDVTAEERAAGITDADSFEFIELANISDRPLDLSEVRFRQTDVGGQTEGIAFSFADAAIRQLGPGQRVLVVEDVEAFQLRYGSQLPVAGQWSGGLNNASEQVTLDVRGVLHLQFTYRDDWYPETDGEGASLEIIDPDSRNLSSWRQATSWRASETFGGTPGSGGMVFPIGDVNRDGLFSSADLLAALTAGEYEDDISGNSTEQEGDWDGDGDFTTADLVFAFQHGNYVSDGPPLNARSLETRKVNQALAATHDWLPFWPLKASDDVEADSSCSMETRLRPFGKAH